MSAERMTAGWVVLVVVACALTAVFLAGVLPPLQSLLATLALVVLAIVASVVGRRTQGGEDR